MFSKLESAIIQLLSCCLPMSCRDGVKRDCWCACKEKLKKGAWTIPPFNSKRSQHQRYWNCMIGASIDAPQTKTQKSCLNIKTVLSGIVF